MKLLTSTLFVAALVAGCGGSSTPAPESPEAPAPAEGSAPEGAQSFEEGMRVLCNSPEEAKITEETPDVRAQKLFQWIQEHVTNAEVSEMFTSLADLPPDQKREKLQEAMTKASITDCPLTGMWELTEAQ